MKKNYFFTLLLTLCFSVLSFGQDLMITGAIDGPLPGGYPKGIELYAINAIPDLSIYGIERAANGNESDGVDYTFPADAIDAGTFIYLAATGDGSSEGFVQYLGVTPQYFSGDININGDDAVVLYENAVAIDVFGVVGVDGSGEDWDHLDGWAYRSSGALPSTTFNVSDWSFSGANALDGCDKSDDTGTNAECDSVFPTGTYTSGATASLKNNTIEGFATYPNPITNKNFTVSSSSTDTKEVAIFSVIGKKVFSTSFSGLNKNLDVSSLNSGVYILKVTEGSKLATKKLVIR
ncbi:T9SS type A sorting domain-containing protein [Polaribacter sp. Asnod1-A03]|uniref:T9SS type A sorting domain-containing protein n=1 Tax=Polaribacter sp. Asnod1-A03 TaxID=3160581 RepID=UPI003863907E